LENLEEPSSRRTPAGVDFEAYRVARGDAAHKNGTLFARKRGKGDAIAAWCELGHGTVENDVGRGFQLEPGDAF
jgi:hypothetical protein